VARHVAGIPPVENKTMDTNIPDVRLAPSPVQAIEFPLSPAQMLYNQLEPLALIGMGSAMVAAMLQLGAETYGLKIAGYRMKILGGPIVCHSRTRELQHHPLSNNAAFKSFIIADRLKWVLDLTELPIGPTEIAMIMYEASLEAPLNDRMAELYIWASKTAMYRMNPENLEVLNTVGSKFPADGPPEQILADPTMKMEYFNFVNEIQRKVLNEQKKPG
jgi:hypothetical protein